MARAATADAPAAIARGLDALRPGSSNDSVERAINQALAMRVVARWGIDEYGRLGLCTIFRVMADDLDPDPGPPDVDVVSLGERDALAARLHSFEKLSSAGLVLREFAARILHARRFALVAGEVMLLTDEAPGSARFEVLASALLTRLSRHVDGDWQPSVIATYNLLAPSYARVEPLRAKTFADPDTTSTVLAEPRPAVISAAPVRPPASGSAGIPLSAALLQWARLQTPRESGRRAAHVAVTRFIALNGDLDVTAITRAHIVSFRDLLAVLGCGATLADVDIGGAALLDHWRARAGTPTHVPLSPASARRDLGAISAILGVMVEKSVLTTNPAAGLRRAGGRGRRLPFTRSMMETMFASPLFTGSAGTSGAARAMPGTHLVADELYWLPLVAALTGARLEELWQLGVDDVDFMRSDGCIVHTIRITGTGEDQSVKTASSERPVPVHSALVELGFVDLVRHRRTAGEAHVFNLSRSSLGTWTQALSQKLNRYIDRVVTDDKRYCFHSFRHEFKDRARDSSISAEVHDAITGHAPTSVGGRYGQGVSVATMAHNLERIDTSFIDLARLMAAAGRG